MLLFWLTKFGQSASAAAALLCVFGQGEAFAQEPAAFPKPARSFWVLDLGKTPPTPRKSRARLVHTGKRSLIYVEDKLFSKVQKEFLLRIAENLEHSTPPGSFAPDKGIVEIAESLFAPLPETIHGDSRLIILFADLGKPNSRLLDGFISPFDYLSDSEASAQGQRSNEANVIYLNLPQKGVEHSSGVIAHQLQRLLSYQFFRESNQDRWLSATLGEAAMLATGFYTNQSLADRFALSPHEFSLVSSQTLQIGPQLLFSAYLLDSIANKKEGLTFLTKSKLNGRLAIESFIQSSTKRPLSFDVIFGNFIGYVFENQQTAIPYSLVGSYGRGLRMPQFRPYISLSSFPVMLLGSLMPYSFLAIDLPEALPLTSVVEVETLRDDARPGSCGDIGTVLWKPIHPKRIAIYAVGCEHSDKSDELQFRLSVFDKPLLN